MTLQDAARRASEKASAFLSDFKVISGLTVADLPPSNLIDILRDAEVHQSFVAEPPSLEMQRILHDARFNPPVFRAAGPPGGSAADFNNPLANELRAAIFTRITLRPIAAPGSI